MSIGMATDPGRISLGWIVSTTFDVLRRRFMQLAGLALLLVSLPQVLSSFLPGGGFIAWLPSLVFYGSAAVIVEQDVRHGGAVPSRMAMGEAWRRIGVLLGVSFLSGLAVIGGLLLLIIPGFFLIVAWLPSGPVAMLEGLGVTQSLGRAWRLTEGHRWALAALCGVFGLALLLVYGLILVGVMSTSQEGSVAPVIGVVILTALLVLVNALFVGVGAPVAYFALREAHDGPGADVAAVFA